MFVDRCLELGVGESLAEEFIDLFNCISCLANLFLYQFREVNPPDVGCSLSQDIIVYFLLLFLFCESFPRYSFVRTRHGAEFVERGSTSAKYALVNMEFLLD